jgi:diaminopimelate epimerase
MLDFHKAHAYGNDFIYVREEDVTGVALPPLARELCDRHAGVGADGLVVYRGDCRQCRMVLLNADGGRAEVSGNGLRGLAAVLLSGDRSGDGRVRVTIETDAGPKALVRLGWEGARQVFRAQMGAPSGLRGDVALAAGGEDLRVVELNMGNPQCVLLGPLPSEARFSRLGPALERHAHFPNGTNVEFAVVDAPDRVRILIWERGVGPTRSSGTGSCAALVAAAAYGGAARNADVIAPGGTQRVEWRDDGVYLTGWAEVLCGGQWMRPLPAV